MPGAVVRTLVFHQCGPDLIPGLGVIYGLSLLLVIILASRGFSPGTPVFSSPQKPTANSNSIWPQLFKERISRYPADKMYWLEYILSTA